ncbi:MAG: bacteriocin fulvocin C-related protein [Acidobacteria bacterium]|nr:bacteriocin fulvocin C-related protein [Acidobacteriota bacterium]
MPQPFNERLKIFNEISAENRALLVKTHVERWLATNRHRLTQEQVSVIEEIIPSISPEKYRVERDDEKFMREIEAWQEKAEAIFSREELRQIVSERADYVPPIEAKKG